MAKQTKAKAPEPIPQIFISFKGQNLHIEGGREWDNYNGVLMISNEEGQEIALFKEWDFARIEYEEEKPSESSI